MVYYPVGPRVDVSSRASTVLTLARSLCPCCSGPAVPETPPLGAHPVGRAQVEAHPMSQHSSSDSAVIAPGYRVVCYPDPVLRKKAQMIEEIDDEVRARAAEMLEIMYESKGVGLAGPQAGWSARIVTVNHTGEDEDERILINPEITKQEGEETDEEGCLSLPGIRGKISRAARVEVEAYDLEGRDVHIEAEGLLARAWQHEIDHLDGVLILDRMSPAAHLLSRRQIKELESAYKEGTR